MCPGALRVDIRGRTLALGLVRLGFLGQGF